jgi:hypothetical protein
MPPGTASMTFTGTVDALAALRRAQRPPPERVGGVVKAGLPAADALGAHSKLVAAAMVGGDGDRDVRFLALSVRGCAGSGWAAASAVGQWSKWIARPAWTTLARPGLLITHP